MLYLLNRLISLKLNLVSQLNLVRFKSKLKLFLVIQASEMSLPSFIKSKVKVHENIFYDNATL